MTSSESAGGQEPVLRHPWRAAIVVALLLGAGSLGAVLVAESDTSPVEPSTGPEIESVTPAPGEILADEITADLRDDLTGVLVIDGTEVPEDQTDRVEPLGRITFRPGPEQDVERFQPGEHTVSVMFWEQGKDRPANPDRYTWEFRSVS